MCMTITDGGNIWALKAHKIARRQSTEWHNESNADGDYQKGGYGMEKRCMKSSRKKLKRQREWEREREGRWKEEGQCRYRDKGKEGRMTLAYYIEIETEKRLLFVRLICSLQYIDGEEVFRILRRGFFLSNLRTSSSNNEIFVIHRLHFHFISLIIFKTRSLLYGLHQDRFSRQVHEGFCVSCKFMQCRRMTLHGANSLRSVYMVGLWIIQRASQRRS